MQQIWRKNITHVPQSIFLIDASIIQNIAPGESSDQIDIELALYSIKIVGLENFVNKLPHKYETIIGERGAKLSGGQKQRLGIARALYRQRKVLVLDEATNSLDYKTESLIIDALNKSQRFSLIFVVAHRLKSLKNCDVIILIENGQIKSKLTYQQLRKIKHEILYN